MDKKQIRRFIKEQKMLLGDTASCVVSELAFSRLELLSEFKRANKILVYNSLSDELSTRSFISRWHLKKKLFLPRVNGDELEILPYKPNALQQGAFHIEEPTGDDIVNANEMDLIIVPAVALDRNGNRVGRGKGYYDRLLATTKAVKIGIIYDFQLFDEFDAESHDIPLDFVITPSEIVII